MADPRPLVCIDINPSPRDLYIVPLMRGRESTVMAENTISTQSPKLAPFEYHLYDMYSEDMGRLRQTLKQVADLIDPGRLSGTLFILTHEMAANSLKAVYKRAYYEYLLKPLGMDDVPYEEWLQLFRSEIESHQADNFANLCRDKDIYVSVRGGIEGDEFRVAVVNDGVPSLVEMERIDAALERANNVTSGRALLEHPLADDDEDGQGDSRREAGNLGIPLIVMSLRGLGLGPESFSIKAEEGKTIARIRIPLALKEPRRENRPLLVLRGGKKLLSIVWDVYKENEMSAVRFDKDGDVLEISESILAQLHIPLRKASEFGKRLPATFMRDVFTGPDAVRVTGRFENYRLYLRNFDTAESILFNVSGHLAEGGSVTTLWQMVTLPGVRRTLSEGSLHGNIRLQSMIEPYIPTPVMEKAREVVRQGRGELPDEVRAASIFFADMVGFTRISEREEPRVVIQLLNTTLGIVVRSIEAAGGQVEKFMGDCVMATFDDPLSAVASAVEIQNQFHQLNELRAMSDNEPVNVRIGINSGTVIMGNIGTPDRKDWTPIGDAVNTASRIEKKADVGTVQISRNTYDLIREHIETGGSKWIKVKGKEEQLEVFTVSRVSFERDGRKITLIMSD